MTCVTGGGGAGSDTTSRRYARARGPAHDETATAATINRVSARVDGRFNREVCDFDIAVFPEIQRGT
jgi:hypothetical protein